MKRLRPFRSAFFCCGLLRQVWQRWRTSRVQSEKEYGASALQLAVEQDLAPVIKALLERNAHDINAQGKVTDENGNTEQGPLAALVTRRKHPDLTWMFLKRGAAQSKEDKEALLCAAADAKNVDLARNLLDQGTDANCGAVFDEWDQPGKELPLTHAVENGDLSMARLLLERGARAEVHYASIDSTMAIAAGIGDDAMIRLLLAHGAKVDKPVRMGTPLCFAAESGHLDVVKTLIAAGADANFDGYGGTALDHALDNEVPESTQERIFALLLNHGADPGVDYKGYFVLIGAANKGRTRVTELLIQHGANVNEVDRWGETPLSCAVEENHVDTARLLLRHGARQRFVGSKLIPGGEESTYKSTVIDVMTLAKSAAMKRLLRRYR